MLPITSGEVDTAESSSNSATSSGPNRTSSNYSTKSRPRRKSDLYRTCTLEYLFRIIHTRQMDFPAAFYQFSLLLISPSRVYKAAYYRKQTKNRWARDDPAFPVIQVLLLSAATFAWALAFNIHSFGGLFWRLFAAIFLEWLGTALLISTIFWWCANNLLRESGGGGSTRSSSASDDTFYVQQRVEWQYAFDIHCNAFFLRFLVIDLLQFIFLPLLLSSTSVTALLVSNLIYSVAYSLYFYIVFLGYSALPFLHQTEKMLYPVIGIIGLFLSSIIIRILFGAVFNCSLMSASYYYGY